MEEDTQFSSGCVRVSERFGMAGSQNNGAHVRRVTTICGTGSKRIHPHVFIGKTVCADNCGSCKFLLELLHFTESSQFKINDRHISAVFWNGLPQLIQITGEMHYTEMVIQRLRQHFRSFPIALSDNYAERFHETFLVI
jgi:hypothetical protein